MNFFRVQHKGYTFEEMCNYDTYVRYDANTGEQMRTRGLCASDSPDGGPYDWGGAMGAMNPSDEVIVIEGVVIEELYDGYVIEPREEIARFTIAEWEEKLADESAYDYEDWG